jgi:hypothetical protein
MWMRHESRPVGREYGSACEFCKGANKAHFCENIGCAKLINRHSIKNELCFHPTPHEIDVYRDIQRDYITLMEKVLAEVIEEQKTNAWYTPKGKIFSN